MCEGAVKGAISLSILPLIIPLSHLGLAHGGLGTPKTNFHSHVNSTSNYNAHLHPRVSYPKRMRVGNQSMKMATGPKEDWC